MTEEQELEAMKYSGWKVWYPTDDELSYFYVNNKVNFSLLENEYLIIKNKEDDNVESIFRYSKGDLVKINHPSFQFKTCDKNKKIINPLNIEQKCAFDLLNNTDITVKLLSGTWGCGKTLLLVSAALDAIEHGKFKKIVWIRNNVDVKDTKDLGALPGEVNEKLLPFLGPFVDQVGSNEKVMKMIADGILDVEPLQYLRGRNIENAIIICSEAENLTREHIQLILARVAKGSNLWLDADIRQRDKSVFEKSKGIEKMISRLKGNQLFGYVKLIVCERSDTAKLADLLDN